MSTFLLILIYLGGCEHTYYRLRYAGKSRYRSVLDTIGWPWSLGMWLAKLGEDK